MRTKQILLLAAFLAALCGCGQAKEPEEKITATVAAKETGSNEANANAGKVQEDKEKKEDTVTKAAGGAAGANKAVLKADGTQKSEKTGDSGAPNKKTPVPNSDAKNRTVKAKNIGNSDKKNTDEDAGEKKSLPHYTVTAFEQARAMYAADPVNVRKGPATDFDRVGSLGRAQEVSVTGQADTGWYEIAFGEDRAFVSDHYLLEQPPAEEPAPPQDSQTQQNPQGQQADQPPQGQQPPVQAVTEVKNVAGVILVGDSRFVQMQNSVGENSCTWIAESGKGYNWFNENAVSRIDGCVGKGSKVLINLGVNDPGNLNNYLTLVNAKAAEWVAKGAAVYYASVNPVWDNPYVSEEQVQYFNSQMQGGLSGDVHWIDSHSYLGTIGYKLVDGLHFNRETYQNLYAYFMSCL